MAWKKTTDVVPEILLPITDPCPDYMMVLRALVHTNKKIAIDKDKWTVEGYQNAARFHFYKLEITTIDQLFEDLQQLAADPYNSLIYGAPTEWALENASELMRRRLMSREDQPASIMTRSASVACGDIDTMILSGLTLDEKGAALVMEKLVESGLKELEHVTVVYNWTSKAGQRDNVARFRFFAIMEQEATLDELKAWANQSGLLDVKIYDPQQPIYIANPTFTKGKSPIATEDRWGLLRGEVDEMPPIPKLNTKPKQSEGQDEPDTILAHLYEEGKVKRQISAGKYDITCPWVHEHSDERDDGTVFMLPNFDGYTQHAFKCQHEHCKERGINDLIAALNIAPPSVMGEDIPDTEDIPSLVQRYAYIKSQDRFYDFKSGQFLKLEAVNRAYAHIHVRPQAGTALLRRHDLVRADDMIYLPGHPRVTQWENKVVLNMWKNQPEVTPIEGDAGPWLKHLKWIMPSKSDQDHFLMWCAYLLQNQDRKINHALLIGGPPRIGKDTLLEPLKRYLGSYNVSEPSAEELKENFTDYLHHRKLVIFQECQNFDKLNVENKLKPMLAAPPHTLRVRLFGQGFYETPNLVQCIFMSNHRNALKISRGDGRYYTIWCEVAPKPRKYYADLYNWLETQHGYAIVVNYLLNYETTGFSASTPPPVTEYKKLMMEMSGSDLEMAIAERISEKKPPFHRDIIKPSDIIEFGGWEGITVKRMVTALDGLQCVPKRIRKRTGEEREQVTLWCIRNKKKWQRETPTRWQEEYKK